jgi:hypothetical protein
MEIADEPLYRERQFSPDATRRLRTNPEHLHGVLGGPVA